jgi:transposase
MPPKDAQKTDPDRVRTRAGNANTHPGMAAKEALRVRNPPRDPDTIQKEKDKKALKKVEKKKIAEDSKAKEQQAAQFIEEYRAQKDSERMNEKAAIPRQKPKGLCCNLFN